MEAEFKWLMQETFSQYGDPGSSSYLVELRDVIRQELWVEAFQVEEDYYGKVLPTSMDLYWLQLDLHIPFLGEHPWEDVAR